MKRIHCVSGKNTVAGLLPFVAVLLLAGCETNTGQLVQEIDAAREGCTDEMLEAGAEECVQMFEKYIQMGTGAIETYIGAVRAFDTAVDRGAALRFDTTGLGHAISPELLNPSAAPKSSALPLTNAREPDTYAPLYAEDAGATRSAPGYRPSYVEPEANRDPGATSDVEPVPTYDSRRPVAPIQQQAPRRGAILPPAERLNRPWIGDDSRQEDYYPGAAERREALERPTEDPRARRPEPSERPPL